jgi:PAS domain S-box-containing protein
MSDPASRPAAAVNSPVPGAATSILRVVGPYALFASLWILCSDGLLHLLVPLSQQERWSIYKGLLFVCVTAVLLAFLVRRNWRNITTTHAALQESEARLRLALHAANQGLYDLNVQTGETVINDEYARMLGHDPATFRESNAAWIERLHPDDRERVAGVYRDYVAGRLPEYHVEFRQRTADGSWKWIFSTGRIVERDAAGQPRRMLGTHTDITERKEAEAALEQTGRQLRALTARLQNLREEERTSIAREIHDELGQALTGLKMDLRWLERKLAAAGAPAGTGALQDRLVEASQLVDSTIATVQRIATDLRPGVLDNLGLEAALRLEARRFQERSGIPCRTALPESPLGVPPPAATGLFRIFQEALTNVLRHAQASAVTVSLRGEDSELVLEIADDGRGITADDLTAPRSLGLLGMKERASLLGGALTIHRGQERGTVVTVRVPRHVPGEAEKN